MKRRLQNSFEANNCIFDASQNDISVLQRKRVVRRAGVLLLEVLVAAAILIVGIGIVSKASYSLRRLWSDTRDYQLASDELANQMLAVKQVPLEQINAHLSALKVSSDIDGILQQAKLTGRVLEDSSSWSGSTSATEQATSKTNSPTGFWIELTMDWKRVGSGNPIRLVGWIDQNAKSPTETDQGESPLPQVSQGDPS